MSSKAAKTKAPVMKPEHFGEIFKKFTANVSRHDCGKYCAPLNGGVPVCCDTENAVPVAHKAEFNWLKSRTDLWRRYVPPKGDKSGQEIIDDLPDNCAAIACKGARFCERDNRSLSCRAFPFFPYITKEREFFGLAHYWNFEDKCWLVSNLKVIEKSFIDEFVVAMNRVFELDPEEFDMFRDHAAYMRRVFTRKKRIIPILGRDGKYYKIKPGSDGRIVPAKLSDFEPIGPYRSQAIYEKAVRKAMKEHDQDHTKHPKPVLLIA